MQMKDTELLPHQFDNTPFEAAFGSTTRRVHGKKSCVNCGGKLLRQQYFRCTDCLNRLGEEENNDFDLHIEGFRLDIY